MTCTHKKWMLILMAALFLFSLSAPCIAAEEDPIQISAQWTDAMGLPMVTPAEPIPYEGYENSYWLQLPQGVSLGQASLFVQDISGTYPAFSFPNGTMLDTICIDAGADLTTAFPLELTGFTADGMPGIVLRLYVSTSSPLPQLPSAPAVMPTADITVYYLDVDNNTPVASPTMKTVSEYDTTVTPAPFDLQPNYELTGEASYNIDLTYDGADRSEVTFYYKKASMPTADITVYYLDVDSNNPVASPTMKTVSEYDTTVIPAPFDLQPNYELTGEASYNINLTYDGADRSEVTFYYKKASMPTADITVYYLDVDTNTPVASPNMKTVSEYDTTVTPAPFDLQLNYELTGETSYNINLTYDGADRSEVTFFYQAIIVPTEEPVVQPVTIPVLYLDLESGLPVASDSSVTIQPGTSVDVYAAPNDLLADYTLSSQSDPMQTVAVNADGSTDVYEVVFYYVYTPATPEPILPQEIVISYYSVDMVQIADATTALCQPGENIITPNQPAIGSEWELEGENSVTVLLDDNGLTPATVTFYYKQKQPAATMAPMPVSVRYVDKNGNNLRSEDKIYLPAGDHPITAPGTLDETYILDGENTVLVHVDEFGANPSIVTFTYRESTVAPKVALVTVKYVEVTSGSTFFSTSQVCTSENENLIGVDMEALRQAGAENYILQSPAVISITVDENGVATPGEAVFQFLKPADPTQTPVPTETPAPTPELQVNVRVYFRTAEGIDVAPYQEVPCFVGNNTIEAAPVNLLPNYVLAGESYQTVTLSETGVLAPEMVVFTYVSTITPVPPTASPFPYEITEVSLWGYPTGDGINFRSEPYTTSRDTIIRTLKRSELCHIIGEMRNGDGEEWYLVDVDGTVGFLKKTVVRQLNEKEIAALFGYTPVPATPSPTPIPENTPIDRWGKTNNKVFFRSSMEKLNNNKLGELKSGTEVWVQHLDSMEGEQWYAVHVNGQAGFVMAEFVDLLSKEESDRLQAALASPAPTATPEATPIVATPVPTPIPTPTVVPTPVPTATPVPYTGYALTMYQVPLRTGATDDAILEWLPADSLVYVNNQTYVAGTSWSYVGNMNSQNYGFILTDALMPISNEAAQYYLGLIAQSKITPSPVPMQQTGYAMTIGDGVPLRSFADTNGEIQQLMPYMAVGMVRGQEYHDNTTWHLVHYNGMWGYVRADQMRMMSQQEVDAYLLSLEKSTPLPTQAPSTPAPITQESLSSYGHVISSSGKVNLRTEPSTDSTRLRLLDNYAFALVMGTERGKDGKTWYHVSQAGTEGYIQGDYFKVLTLSELTRFLQSNEYKAANTQTSQSGNNTSGQLQPVEDYNQNVWQNPALTHTYAPFVPPTATPDPERLPTSTPIPTPIPTSVIAPAATATASFAPITGGFTPTPETTKDGGSALPWILLGLGIAGGGGVIYAYSLHKQNERRRQAVRAQQARQAAARAQAQAGQPQTRMASNQVSQGTRAYNTQAAPFMPNGSGAPTAQQTTAYKPVSQQTGSFKPVQPVSQQTGSFQPIAEQQTTAYKPRTQSAPVSQGTQTFTPASQQTVKAPEGNHAPEMTEFSSQTAQNTPRRRRSDKYDS